MTQHAADIATAIEALREVEAAQQRVRDWAARTIAQLSPEQVAESKARIAAARARKNA